MRTLFARLRRTAAGFSALSAVALTGGGADPPDPYPAPGPLPRISAPTLDLRYAANRRAIGRSRAVARRIGDEARDEALSAFLAPGRRFLSFDGRGRGQAVEVVGDLKRADRVAVLVPGADTTLTSFDHREHAPYATPGGGARAILAQARLTAPGTKLAVIAWLGYPAPQTLSTGVLTDGHARRGADDLRRLIRGLRTINPHATASLLCHSYGSVVCAEASSGLPVSDLAVFGSPGMRVRSAHSLRTPARVWAGRGTGDWMRYVPHVEVLGLGLGPDPVSAAFGARRLATGRGGHSDYLKPGSASLRNLTFIALGRTAEVAIS